MWSRNVARRVYMSHINFSKNQSNLRVPQFSKTHKSKEHPIEIVKWGLLVIPIGAFALGTWQVKRREWKLKLIQEMKQKTNTPAVDLPQDLSHLQEMEYSPVKVRGRFLHNKEMLIGPRALIDNDSMSSRAGSLFSDPKKNQGWLVVTPFQLSDIGKVILVNRGWVHNTQKSPEKRAASLVEGEVELTGVVRLSEHRPPFMPKNNPEKGQWYTRDLEAMSDSLGCSPVWLDARGIPDPPPGWPVPNQTRITLRNEHFSYILTWYSMSALTALMWYRLFIKKRSLL